MKRRLVAMVVVVSCLLAVVSIGLAAPKKDGETKKELPKSGSLATSGDFGSKTSSTGLPWGSEDAGISGGQPITGSISRINTNEWMLKVFNNSKDSYSVSLQVLQYTSSGSKAKSDSYSYSLAPGKSAERKVSAGLNVARAEVNLTNWRKTGSAKKEAKEEQAEAPATTDTASRKFSE